MNIDPKDIRSLTEFQRNAKTFVHRLRRSGRPEVLTVNGRAALVVQDAAAYARSLADDDRARTVAAVREGLAQAERGEGRGVDQAFAAIRRKVRARRRKAS